ncbi:type IV secretory system conjugative DNA transfer family protein [Hyphomicrobium sp. DY-1]|uniref:type IV secretory system conjugative DNA transfer family protein n=1 Tax=Hyphomicrobium sp. DY-1 TaxID=3075650 RepID=UPI0039C3F282
MTAPSSSPIAHPKILRHPLRNPGDYTTTSFVTTMEEMLTDPAARFCLPVGDLIVALGRDRLEEFIRAHYEPEKPSAFEFAAIIFNIKGSSSIGNFGDALKHGHAKRKYRAKLQGAFNDIFNFEISRAAISLNDKERQLMRGLAQLVARHLCDPDDWGNFFALIVHNGGEAIPQPTENIRDRTRIGEMQKLLVDFFRSQHTELTAVYANAAQVISQAAKSQAFATTPVLNKILSPGAHWMTEADLATSAFYTTAPTPTSVIVGYEPVSQKPVYYSDAESLITVGGPGSGKSQAQVIPNLLRHEGSAIILDVKGELWNLTAGYRAKHFGPVYRFAPTDPNGATHRYNPFDFIPKSPDDAANECTIFSLQVIEDNPNLTDPYWTNRGRDMMWAYAMVIALNGSGKIRTVQGLAELLATPPNKIAGSDILRLADIMDDLGQKTGVTEMALTAHAIRSGVNSKDRFESVLDNARRFVNIFNRGPRMAAAMATSDWRPEYFRTRPGTSLYICLSPAELKAYAPVIRAMLVQHSRTMQKMQMKPGEKPITFFLDEMPQLGNFTSILELQDVGRSAGLRLWMFAQSLGQLSEAFGRDRYEGVVDACRVRCFLQPDNQAAKMIEPNLGRAKDLLSGVEKPLADAAELMGRPFKDKIIVTSRGETPMSLDKKYAWQTDKAMFLPTPVVKPASMP